MCTPPLARHSVPFRLSLGALLAAGLGLGGCSMSGSGDQLPPDMRQLSIVSVRGSAERIPTSGTFAWQPGSRVLITAEDADAPAIELMVRQALGAALERRGFTPGSRSTSDLIVGYVIALEDTDHASVSEAFGMDPGLLPAASGQSYPRGTLVVEITKRGSPTPLWRGAVQAHSDLSLDEKLRRQRIDMAVERLLGDLNW